MPPGCQGSARRARWPWPGARHRASGRAHVQDQRRELGCVARLDPGAECGQAAQERAAPALCRPRGHLGIPRHLSASRRPSGQAGSPASVTGSRRSIVIICFGLSFAVCGR
jgi:hypothetical protein